MKKALPYFLLTCFFMLVNQMAIAQVSNINQNQPNVFEKNYGTAQSQQTRGATDALVYIDFEIEDGQVLAALTNLGYTYVVATDWADFFSKLSYPTYKLAVMFNQGNSWSPDVPTVANFISAGGSIVYADWTHNAALSALFQASFTGVDNQTEMALNPTIATGLPNPMTLANTGWIFVFSTGLIPTGGAEVLATFPNGNASIVKGSSGKTIILGYLSDVPPAANRQQLFENLFLSVTAPADPTSITATVNPTCYGAGTQLTANGAVGTVYWYTGSCGGTAVSPPTGNSITVNPTATTTYYARNYNDGQYSAGCASLQITVSPTPVLSGASNVTQGQVVTYSTPYKPGNSYSWNASHGNPELCFPNHNCLTLTWDFPCGIINPGYVTLTETDPSTGCSATITKWITIAP